VLVGAERVEARLLFLHWLARTNAGEQPWLEAQEREVRLGPFVLNELCRAAVSQSFGFEAAAWQRDTTHYRQEAISGFVRASARRVTADTFELTVVVANQSPPSALMKGRGSDPARWQSDDADFAERASLGGAHLLLQLESGRFWSLLEPPAALSVVAHACKNDGVWPVLVGDTQEPRTVLASPIMLYDFPAVAPESPGDFCDATEMDEMLALRVRTLTEAEKAEARGTDPRARQIVERSDGLPEAELLGLHGVWREPWAEQAVGPRPGDRVRICPKPGRDVLDLALAGELATVVSLEQDAEGRKYCTVTIDADPGRDLGLLGQPGHRFFFELEELEPAP
jgi:hypothetical protein